MARNILVFSDGTGQVGGYAFDEDRTNVYKLYRATRVGPDSCIDPSEKAAFYDPRAPALAVRADFYSDA
jgi:Uncharacterized alpha/beta hydrolase domain (DUF2235)